MSKSPETIIKLMSNCSRLSVNGGDYSPETVIKFAHEANLRQIDLTLRGLDRFTPETLITIAQAGGGSVMLGL